MRKNIDEAIAEFFTYDRSHALVMVLKSNGKAVSLKNLGKQLVTLDKCLMALAKEKGVKCFGYYVTEAAVIGDQVSITVMGLSSEQVEP